MYIIKPKQTTFAYGPEIFAKMVPDDHFLRQADGVINFGRCNHICKDLYCQDNGRQVTNTPERMMRASFVQYYYNLSDRELEEQVNLNLAARWFVGLNLEEEVFHFDALSDFRLRLGEERFRIIFDDILEQAFEKKLMDRNEPVKTDATHMIADIAIPTTIRLIQDYMRRVLAALRAAMPDRMESLPIELAPYMKKPDDEPKEHALGEDKRKERLAKAANAAIALIKWHESLDADVKASMGESLSKEFENLNRILHDYIERKRGRGRPPNGMDAVLDGKGVIRERKEKGKDRIVSAVDPDARHGAKSDSKHFTGYKLQTTQNMSGVTVAVEVLPGNVNEESRMFPQIDEMAERDIKPPKVIGDGLFGSEGNRIEAEKRGIILSSPVRKPTNPTGLFPASDFEFHGDSVTCPGERVAFCVAHQNDRKWFRFDELDCLACQLKPKCTKARSRIVTLSDNYEVIQRAIRYNETEEGKQDKKERAGIERSYSVGKGSHGLARARYRTNARIAVQGLLTFIVINVKRLVTLAAAMAEKLRAGALGGGGLAIAIDTRAAA